MTDKQFRSVWITTLAILRWTKISPGRRSTIWFDGTRLSEQPIHKYSGFCCRESFAKKSRGSELRAIQLTIETDRWQWYDGKRLRLIQPNSIIDVISPSNNINRRTRFFVEEVTFEGSTTVNKAVLKCVLPECYTGGEPKNVFA